MTHGLKSIGFRVRTGGDFKTKVRFQPAAICPNLLYERETCPTFLKTFPCYMLLTAGIWKWFLTWNGYIQSGNTIHVRHHYGIPQLAVRIAHRMLWFGFVNKYLNLTPCWGWKYRPGGQLKTWLTAVKSDIENLGLQSVHAVRHWRQDWVVICAEMSANYHAWETTFGDIHKSGSSFPRTYQSLFTVCPKCQGTASDQYSVCILYTFNKVTSETSNRN